MRITKAMLEAHGACADQVAIFAAEWPRGCKVTLKACKRVVELRLNLNWAAEHLLSPPAWAAYQQATAPALAAYQQATAPAFWAAVREPRRQEE
jgi:hypothetical protein